MHQRFLSLAPYPPKPLPTYSRILDGIVTSMRVCQFVKELGISIPVFKPNISTFLSPRGLLKKSPFLKLHLDFGFQLHLSLIQRSLVTPILIAPLWLSARTLTFQTRTLNFLNSSRTLVFNSTSPDLEPDYIIFVLTIISKLFMHSFLFFDQKQKIC